MKARDSLLLVFVMLTVALAVVSAIEMNQVFTLQNEIAGTSCVQTGIHGELLVLVVADGTGQPVQDANVTAIILGFCQAAVHTLDTVRTNSSGYAIIPTDWAGNFTVAVFYSGRTYYFLAWTGASINVATLSVPSGVSNVATVKCLGPFGAC